MPLNDMLGRMRDIFPDFGRNRKRRNSNCIDGPPPKLGKNLREHRFIRDEPHRTHQMRKSLIGSMGSIISKLKFNSNACEPTEFEEYSDGEDVIILQKFKKNDLTSHRWQQLQQINNIQPHKMDAVNNRSSSTRPVPKLIHKNKFSQVPDLQKYIKPQNLTSVRTPRINGYQCENESTSSSKSCLVNGNTLPFKTPSSQHSGNNLYSNYFNSTSGLPRCSITPRHQQVLDKQRYEELIKSVFPDYGHSVADHATLPTSKRSSIAQNRISARPPIRRSVIQILDDDITQRTEDTRRLFGESSINSERTVTPINTMRLKIDATPVCQTSYPDTIKERYSFSTRERQEKINQQEEKSKNLTKERLQHCNSYESLFPQWRTPEVIIFEEDLEEKIDDFPEFSDSQKKQIRDAMTGASPHTVLRTKFNLTITRSHILTLQWEPLAWLNDEVINFYMNLLTERGEKRANDGYPKVYAMNTFFTQRLSTGGYSAVRRWTKKVDIFACDIIPVPVHVGNVHWCMAIINMKEKTIKYYDSMGHPNQRVLVALEDYLREESLDKRKIEFDLSGWSKENVTDNPHQQNGSDCGVFSCMTAEFICRNRPIVFNQNHMNYFRQRMVLEICNGEMML